MVKSKRKPAVNPKIAPEIGIRIARARASLNLTQREFADRIGVSQGLVGAWESHQKSPGTAKLKKIALETGVSMDAILGGGPVTPEILEISDPDEIKLIVNYRRLPTVAKKNSLEIVEMTANIGRVQKKKRAPTEVA